MKLSRWRWRRALMLAGRARPRRSAPTSSSGMQLEPPILDPTAGAAAAIDEVVYANVFEGLTRFAPDGVDPAGAGRELGDRAGRALLGLPPARRA